MSRETPGQRAGPPLAHTACPLCGGPNGCAPARSGRFDTPCWCTTVSFDPAALARAGTRSACLCRRCAEGAAAASGNPSST